MDLLLLRHAEAGEAARDELRELTAHGHLQARAAAAGIARLVPDLGLIMTSPLPRAAQTAQAVAAALGQPIATAQALATGRTAREALSLLGDGQEPVMLVGHEPQLSGIVQLITGGRIHMRKAMLARIELHALAPAADGELAWLLSWRHLERLGQ